MDKDEAERRCTFEGYFLLCRFPVDEEERELAIEQMAKLARTFEEWSIISLWTKPGTEPARRAQEEMDALNRQAKE
ncbi:MAG: hypothetical protein WC410_02815 [Candidatus Paceibacterota bacterium]|jgi:hypothetical protein|nr:hypothetical protein [Candidatus Paceibacterota bacterium]MDD5555316.1 hypothetical protein [Candidatus Paceibacterota bacterium]